MNGLNVCVKIPREEVTYEQRCADTINNTTHSAIVWWLGDNHRKCWPSAGLRSAELKAYKIELSGVVMLCRATDAYLRKQTNTAKCEFCQHLPASFFFISNLYFSSISAIFSSVSCLYRSACWSDAIDFSFWREEDISEAWFFASLIAARFGCRTTGYASGVAWSLLLLFGMLWVRIRQY